VLRGIAVALSELPAELIARHGLGGRVHDRGGEPELRFLAGDRGRVLPVWLGGRLRLARWGGRRTACVRLTTLERGDWGREPAV
jgi:hypothetical protein